MKDKIKRLISEMLNEGSVKTIKQAFKEIKETERLASANSKASNDTYRKLYKQRKSYD